MRFVLIENSKIANMRISLMMLLLVPGMLLGESTELAQARNFYRHTDYPAAIHLLSNIPVKDAPVNELLGQCYFASGYYKKATAYFESAAAAEPRNSVYQLWLGRVYGRRAENSFPVNAMSWANRSRSALEKAVELDVNDWEAVDDLFDFYLQAPGLVGGGVERAEKLTPIIARRDPAEAAYDQARIAEARKQYDTAEQYLKRAAELAPRQPSRYVALARFCARHDRFEESDRYFRQAEEVAPGAPRVYFAEASTYIKTNRNVDTAKVLLKKYLSASNLTPDDPPKSEAEKLLRKVSGS
jgi:tetratricopeptide (TPR) repeat protein